MSRGALPRIAVRGLLGMLLLLLMGVLITACGGGGDSTGSTSEEPASSEPASSEAEGEEKEDVTIAFFVYPAIEAYKRAGEGAEAAGAADGSAEIVTDGPSEPNESNDRTYATNLVQSAQPDGFAAVPNVWWPTLLPEITRQIPNENVLGYDAVPIEHPSDPIPAGAETIVGPSFYEGGVKTIEAGVKAAKMPKSTTGTALIGLCYEGIKELSEGVEGMEDGLAKALPNVEVHVVQTALTPQQSAAKWASALNKYSDVVFATGACEPDTNSLLLMKERGIGGEFVASVNGVESPTAVQAIADGKLVAGVTSDFWVQGNLSAKLLIEGARGKPLPKGWIDTGQHEITKENAAEYLNGFKSEAGAEELFGPVVEEVEGDLKSHTKKVAEFIHAG